MLSGFSWTGFIVGVVFALFVFPFLTSLLAGRRNQSARAAA